MRATMTPLAAATALLLLGAVAGCGGAGGGRRAPARRARSAEVADAWIRLHQQPGQMVLVKIGRRTMSRSSDQRVTRATLRALCGLHG